MVARGALWNASVFSPEGKVPWEDVKIEYIRKVELTCDLMQLLSYVLDFFVLQWNWKLFLISIFVTRRSLMLISFYCAFAYLQFGQIVVSMVSGYCHWHQVAYKACWNWVIG